MFAREEGSLALGLLKAWVAGTISAYLGLWFGTWMTRVRR